MELTCTSATRGIWSSQSRPDKITIVIRIIIVILIIIMIAIIVMIVIIIIVIIMIIINTNNLDEQLWWSAVTMDIAGTEIIPLWQSAHMWSMLAYPWTSDMQKARHRLIANIGMSTVVYSL